jgi:hypothetical protein
MRKDPIVEQVRAVREKQARLFDFDIKKMVADAKRKQGTSGRRVVSFAGEPRAKRTPQATR